MYDCHLMEGEDTRWLHTDMSIQCFTGGHLTAAFLSAVMLLAWGAVLPSFVGWMGSGVNTLLHGQARFKFLFDGYKENSKWCAQGWRREEGRKAWRQCLPPFFV